MLTKINSDDIKWSNLVKPNFLYRGNSQTMFEIKYLNHLLKDGGDYFGCRSSGNILTFCDNGINILSFSSLLPHTHSISNYNEDEIRNMIKFESESFYPLTMSPLIMVIDIEKYKDRLYRSDSGWGIIIKDPINFDDIKIIASSKNKYEFLDYINEKSRNGIKLILEEDVIKYIPQEDLIDRYHKNRDLYRKLLLDKLEISSEISNKKVDEAIEKLEEKLS